MCGGVLRLGADRSSAEGQSHEWQRGEKNLWYLPSSHVQGMELVSLSQASYHIHEITTAAPLHKNVPGNIP